MGGVAPSDSPASRDNSKRWARRSRSHSAVAIEAASPFGWHRWADDTIGIDRFGASAPGGTVLDRLGINVDHVVARAQALIAR